jgi:hypothetical protein
MVAIFVWAAVILWCIAALFLVSLPFVFAIMHLIGKGNLAKSWWLKIKPRLTRSSSQQHVHPNYVSDAKYSFLECNVYHHRTNNYR